MNGIEKIIERIRADAQAEVDSIQAQADTACSQIHAEYEQKARDTYDALMKKGTAEIQVLGQRLVASGQMEQRKALLGFRQEMVSEAFDKAVAAIAALPEEKYIEFFASLAAEACDGENAELVFSAQDSEKSGPEIVRQANMMLQRASKPGRLTMSSDTANIAGGLLLRRGRIEINCSAELLVSQCRDALASQVAAILFE